MAQQNAFHGDEAARREALERVARLMRAGQLSPSMKLNWNETQQTGTYSGALAQSLDAAAFPDRTGMPLELPQAFEVILMLAGQPDKERKPSFPPGFPELFLSWLDAVHPGADLSGVLPRFIAGLLDELLAPQAGPGQRMGVAQREVVQHVAELWHRSLSGQAVAAQAWRGPRAEALELADSVDDPWAAAVAEFAASVAWPPAQCASEAPGLLMRLFMAWVGFLGLSAMTAEEQSQAADAALEPRRMRIAAQQPGFDMMAWHMGQMQARGEGKSKEALEQAAARGREIRALVAPSVAVLVKQQLDRLIELTRSHPATVPQRAPTTA